MFLGVVFDEFNKVENEGVKEFLGIVIDFGVWIFVFFDGVGGGFFELMFEVCLVFFEF